MDREADRLKPTSDVAATQPVLNRWLVVGGAILIQLCLGAIYAWSVFTKKITLPIEDGGLYGFSAAQAAWVFSAGLASFAGVMLFAGRWQARIGPRLVAMTGGLVLGTGYILGGFLGGPCLSHQGQDPVSSFQLAFSGEEGAFHLGEGR